MVPEFWAPDRKYGVIFAPKALADLSRHCGESVDSETGGILLGKYSDDLRCAEVEMVTGPPSDSTRTRSFFRRGVDGLQRLLDRLWAWDRTFYIGEWHFHPAGVPSPSGVDRKEMREIAGDRGYHCPEPVLLVMGVEDQAQVWVFPKGSHRVRLLPCPGGQVFSNPLETGNSPDRGAE